MYTQHHYHSNTHEVLCIFSGKALICFGGGRKTSSDFEDAVELVLQRGDVVLIPAGVGHALIQEIEAPFRMIGSYPKGGDKWDMCIGREEEMQDSWARIGRLGGWEGDPIYGGKNGPLFENGGTMIEEG